MPPLKARDRDYVEARLDAPGVPAREAQERLREAGFVAEADEIVRLTVEFEERVREVRGRVEQRERALEEDPE